MQDSARSRTLWMDSTAASCSGIEAANGRRNRGVVGELSSIALESRRDRAMSSLTICVSGMFRQYFRGVTGRGAEELAQVAETEPLRVKTVGAGGGGPGCGGLGWAGEDPPHPASNNAVHIAARRILDPSAPFVPDTADSVPRLRDARNIRSNRRWPCR